MFHETLAIIGIGVWAVFCLGLTAAAWRWASARPAAKVLIAALDRNATATEANTKALERLYDEKKAERIDRSIAEAKVNIAAKATPVEAPAQRDTITTPPPEPDEDPTMICPSLGLSQSPQAAEAPL